MLTTRSLRRLAPPLVFGLALLAAACATEGNNFCFLGYTTAPNYDPNIRTVRVPIFKNKTFRQNLEFDLTREVCHAIARDTPFRIVNGEDEPADTELCGTIVSLTKGIAIGSPVNEERFAQATLTVEISWRDLRTGQVLSRPSRRPGEALRPEGLGTPPILDPYNNPALKGLPAMPTPPARTVTPEVPVDPPGTTVAPAVGADGGIKQRVILPDGTVKEETIAPVVLHVSEQYSVELGQSLTTAEQRIFQKTAQQITHLMEKSW